MGMLSLKHFAGLGSGTIVTLSGTAGSPNEKSETATLGANIAWTFNMDGTVNVDGVQFQAGVEWSNKLLSANATPKWIRATANSGEPPDSGDTLNTWHKLVGSGSDNRNFAWTSQGNAFAGSVQIDIATDSGGVNIIATGFYGARFT